MTIDENMLYITCPLCGTSHFRSYCRLNGWQLVQCLSCKLVYVNPRPSEEEINKIYHISPEQETTHHSNTLTDVYQNYYAHTSQEKNHDFADTVTQLLHLVKVHPSQCKLLDFGCGNGAFIEQALHVGVDAYGYDAGDWCEALLQEKNLSPRVFIGNWDRATYPDESFDIIYSRGVLEHLYYPQKTLRRLHQKLKPNGVLMLTGIPNLHSIFIMLKIDSYDGNVPLAHLSFFSKAPLIHLLQQQAFQPISIKTWGVPLRLTLPAWFPQLAKSRNHYYQSVTELSIDHWQERVVHSQISFILRKLLVYPIIKAGCNWLLNTINGGAVIDIIARKLNIP